MTLEQLRIFVAVAEREHVTEAAKVLNLTQSATSAAVSALEERHDVRLFNRVGRRIELTETGRFFLGEARAVLARADEAALGLEELAGMRRGKLRLAASQTIANYWLPAVMNRFHRTYPGIELTLTVTNTDRVAAIVRDGEADLGFVEDLIDDPQLVLRPVADDELVLVVSSDHPWGTREHIADDDLLAATWIMREPGSGTRRLHESALSARGIRPSDLDVFLELPSNEAVCGAVVAGGGASILSRLVVEAGVQAGTLKIVPFHVPARNFHSMRHTSRHRPRAALSFEALVADEFPVGGAVSR